MNVKFCYFYVRLKKFFSILLNEYRKISSNIIFLNLLFHDGASKITYLKKLKN